MYLIKSPKWLRALAQYGAIWEMPENPSHETVYLTFDDGPHATATPFVLEQLAKYNATATFFCIGKNVIAHPEIMAQLKAAGHTIGNHTNNHLNGWHTSVFKYVKNVLNAARVIDGKLFRPPYGRLKRSQAQILQRSGFKIIMWSLLSGDFDTKITPEKCWENVQLNLAPGNIVVFHDSEKALPRLRYTLPKVLAHCQQNNWKVKALQ